MMSMPVLRGSSRAAGAVGCWISMLAIVITVLASTALVACERAESDVEQQANANPPPQPVPSPHAAGAGEDDPATPSTPDEATEGSATAAPAVDEPTDAPAGDERDDAPALADTVPGMQLGNLDVEGELPGGDSTTFRMALSHAPQTFDPALVTDTNSAQIAFNTFEGLMSFDSVSGPVVPGVARRYEVSDEGRTYTFHLRKDARWSNGDRVTAFDFEYAWKRALAPATGSAYAFIMTDVARIAGAAEFHAGTGAPEAVGVTAIDRYTLEVRLEAPVANFVEMTALCTFAPVHRRTLEEHGEQWFRADNWVSNGPFVLVSHRDDRQFVLRKNPEYWDADEVALERISVRVIEDDAGRLDAFEAGLIDWTGPTSLPVSPRQRERLEFQYHQDPFLAVEYVAFNTTEPPLDDARVRQAIAMAIDRNELVVKALEGVGRPASGFVPPLPGFRSQVRRGLDVERARKLLTEAGIEDPAELDPIRYTYPRNNGTAATMARLVQQQLAAGLGVRLELVGLEVDALNEALDSGDFQIVRLGWGADYISPSTFLTLWSTGNDQNQARFSSPAYDDLLEQAGRTTDRVARIRLYEQAELLLDREMPVSPLAYYEQTYVLRSTFQGLEPHVLSVHLLKYLRPAE